jgi:hypothetical protein
LGLKTLLELNCRGHGNRNFTVCDLNLATDSHDGAGLGLLAGEIRQLHQIAASSGLLMSTAPVFLAISTASPT